MRIAIDAHAIGRHLTGNEVYVRSLLNAFAALDQDCEFTAYVSSEAARQGLPPEIRSRRIAANPYLRLGYQLPLRVRQDRPDLLHVQYTAPIGCNVPVVVIVHDVSFLEHPEYFTPWRAWQLQQTVRRTVSSASKILTVSEFSRKAILKVYGDLDEDKVVVVPNAADSGFRPILHEAAVSSVRQRFAINQPFLLCVGDIQPRKNQIGLIQAFSRLVRAWPRFKHDLVLVGKPTWFADRVHEAARESGVSDRIRFVGFVSDDDLLQLYNACDLFVFPSFYEGFGLPPLEAMACGRAVTCSNTTAMPEVVDGAAILFDPYRVEEIARAIADILLDADLRTRMERRGLQRAAHFSWQKTAERTLDVFHGVAEQFQAAPRRGRPTRSATIVHR